MHRVGFMGGLGGRNHRGVGDKWEMDARVGHQIGLEFGKINVERTIESKGGSDGGNDCDQC